MRSIAVIGLGNFGSSVALELAQKGAQVIALDQKKERVEALKDQVAYAATLNAMDQDALKALNVQDVDVAVVCIGQDVEANLLTTLLLKKIGVRKVWARAINPLQREILKALDVDQILSLEEEMGRTVAASLISANITKHIPVSKGQSIAEVKVPARFMGQSIRQIDPRKKFNINIVAVKKRIPSIDERGQRTFQEQVENVPPPDVALEEADVLLIAGGNADIDRFAKE